MEVEVKVDSTVRFGLFEGKNVRGATVVEGATDVVGATVVEGTADVALATVVEGEIVVAIVVVGEAVVDGATVVADAAVVVGATIVVAGATVVVELGTGGEEGRLSGGEGVATGVGRDEEGELP
jgi:hypothetical protein